MKYRKWKKKEADNVSLFLSENFHASEFTCQCKNASCVDQMISQELLNRLESVRRILNKPIVITSGFRCHAHQLELTQKGYETANIISQHELGNAADITVEDPFSFRALGPLAEVLFKSIGYSKRFIHVDLRDDKVRKWYYKN